MNKRVLIVEDEGLVAMLLEELLGRMGYEVVAIASTLDEAMELAQTLSIDIAILDINLNGQESFPVADLLGGRGIPFLFATGYGDSILGSRFAAAAIIEKPFSRDVLREALAAL